ncbi:MAG: Gfo/Idh/MocA family oxidoreductase [Ilumatobacteraceae bacterium]
MHAYRDLTAMLEAERPTVVTSSHPRTLHPALAAQCAEAGCHVICEKPAAGTLGELDAMLATADGNGTWLMESQNYRYNQPVLDLVAAIGSGRVGGCGRST